MTGIRPEHPRIDGRTGPLLGVDDLAPVLSWSLAPEDDDPGGMQTAYHAEVTDPGGKTWWDTGIVASGHTRIRYAGPEPAARQRLRWRVRVRDEHDRWSPWSAWSCWELGLLTRCDWAEAGWIAHPDRDPGDPLPIFARTFTARPPVHRARLYVCGLGIHVVTLNGRPVTSEVLAPGNSNYQRSAEYRVHDVAELLHDGENTLGIALGHGTAHVHRHGTNGGARSVYSWWTSEEPARGALLVPAQPGADRIRVAEPDAHHVGGAVTIGTRESWESRQVVAVGDQGLIIAPPLEHEHPAGTPVEGSGDPVAQWEPTAGAAVSPRLLARLEITGPDGRRDIVSGPDWRTALGPAVTDNWFSGTDHNARREQPGWDLPGADHSAAARRRDGTPTGWVAAARTTPPNGTTELVWRQAAPVRIVREWRPAVVREPIPGRWVFDLGQNIAGWPELRLPPVPPGTVVTVRPGESLHADGTVDQTSIRNDRRGTDVLHTYTAAGLPDGERWRPSFQYFAMRFLEVTAPVRPEVRGLQLRADAPRAGSVRTSDERVDRLHRMAHFSVASNLMSVLTDCPGREKLAYGADYTHPMGVLSRHFDLGAYLRTMQRHLAEGQAGRGPDVGNVALKAPVYDWGYQGAFGDEVNWGNAIVLVPWLLHRIYGDTRTMAEYYPNMTEFLDYLRRRKTHGNLVTGELGDWVAAEETSGELTGTWGYHATARALAEMAGILGNVADSREFGALADDIAAAFHQRFYVPELGRYSGDGTEAGATQAAQAMPLDAGIVPAVERDRVLAALVERIRTPDGSHLRAGHLGLGPVVRVLRDADRDDVLWEVSRQDAAPSYGAFLQDTAANPGGLTTIPEQWDMRNSLNHMILTQLDEWFHTGLAGIRQAAGSAGFRALRIRPKVVGELRWVAGHYTTPAGRVESRWVRDDRDFTLTVRIPPNTTARVHVPGRIAGASRIRDGCGIFEVGPGVRTFHSTLPRPDSPEAR
ncbi:alpha-L-rhamnosidase [Saccharopolyspora gloriosae]|uniref:alpha-L-rhamnosidase n=1 Tax=Saccharopolyspora gloriosae TaxID=455344 RepID=UPI001FB6AE8B|nr:alpha-L-rhamnosidase [Saccharopolyspora gloriosae]